MNASIAHAGKPSPSVLRLLGRMLGDFTVVAVAGLIAAALLVLGAQAFWRDPPLSLLVLLEAGAQLCLLLALLWWDRLRPLPAPVVPLRVRWQPRMAVLVGMLAGCMLLLLDPALVWLLERLGAEDLTPANDAIIRESLEDGPLLALLSIGVLAPWLEERFFRGRLFGHFRNAGRPVAGIVLTSLLFALLHEFGPDEGQRLFDWLGLVGLYAVMGAVFAALYAWSGRLRTAIIAHAVNNLIYSGLYVLELA